MLSSVSQNNKFGMLWFGEYISNNFDSQIEERAHQEVVLDSLLLQNEILGPARAVNAFSACCLIKRFVESVGLSFGVLFYGCRTVKESSRRKVQTQDNYKVKRPSKPGFRFRILYLYS